MIKIALTGNPNSGKTTVFNQLTGSSQYVGNWPGVTIEKKEGFLQGRKTVSLIDLPGIYSLSPYSLEEVVSRDYLLEEHPDAILNIVDASNLERNLFLTLQLIETGIPVVVALNMFDVVARRGDRIHTKRLGKWLGSTVVENAAIRREGLDSAADAAIQAGTHKATFEPLKIYSDEVEAALEKISSLLLDSVTSDQLRWYAVRIFERDEKTLGKLNLSAEKRLQIDELIKGVEAREADDSENIITYQRYEYISKIIADSVVKQQVGMSVSDKIDRIVTNRWLGLPIFALVMTLVYYLAISTIGTQMTDWVNDVLFGEIIPPAIENGLQALGTADWLQSLVLDGIVAGVGAVLGFLPQMMVLFLCLAILEDSGYMARIAFVMDRIFRKFGLSGKSFIPILIGTGCSVPGIMASRTIENEKDRRMTIITTSFMPCSAKLPIIALIASALFGGVWWVGPSAYFVGIAAIILSGIILKKSRMFSGDVSPFVMELPAYHWPSLRNVVVQTWDRLKAFVKKAGTIILVASAVIWFTSSFNWSLQMSDVSDSILASIGNFLKPLFVPLGWGDWKAVVAAISGLVAKENVVGTFGILYGFAEVAEDGAEIWDLLRESFTGLTAYSFLLFNLLCAPCFAAIGAIRREMNCARWTWFAVAYQTILAYVVSFMFYHLGSYIVYRQFTAMTGLAAAFLLVFVYLIVRRPSKRVARAAC